MFKRIASVLAICLLALSISTAFAQSGGEFVYSVKFVCGVNETNPQGAIVEPGIYATEINIHNYRPEGVEVKKEVLILVENGEAIGREPQSVGVRGRRYRVDPTATMTIARFERITAWIAC